MKIEDLNINKRFDGIWASASLLHVEKSEMNGTVKNLIDLLNPKGILYASWKYGNGERIDDGKYYSDYDEDQIRSLSVLEKVLSNIWVSCDPVRSNIKWTNLLIKKTEERL